MTEYFIWGGYSYSVSTEKHDNIVDVAWEYLRRMAPSNQRFPLWGDAGDEYVVTTEHEGWKIADLERIVESAWPGDEHGA